MAWHSEISERKQVTMVGIAKERIRDANSVLEDDILE